MSDYRKYIPKQEYDELKNTIAGIITQRNLAENRGRRWMLLLCRVDERVTAMLTHIGRDILKSRAGIDHYRFMVDLIKIKRELTKLENESSAK